MREVVGAILYTKIHSSMGYSITFYSHYLVMDEGEVRVDVS